MAESFAVSCANKTQTRAARASAGKGQNLDFQGNKWPAEPDHVIVGRTLRQVLGFQIEQCRVVQLDAQPTALTQRGDHTALAVVLRLHLSRRP
jgi:hypothetical protein